tara:strand:+ start:3305 stop:4489 length:1185 start_codon:yes stop_codon:yes gene_type:complete
MEVIFLIGAIQAIFLSALLLAKKKKMIADIILFACLMLAGIHLFSYYLYSIDVLKEYPFFNILAIYLPMLEGAFTYVYIRTMTSKQHRFNKINFLHAVPYLILTLVLFVMVFFNENSAVESISEIYKNTPLFIEITSIFNSLLGPIYIVLSWRLLQKHKKNILQDFSYTEEIDLKWLKYVVILMGTIWVVVLAANVLSHFTQLITDKMANDLIYYSVAIVIFLEGYFGIKQQVIYTPALKSEHKETKGTQVNTIITGVKENSRYEKSGLKKDESKKYLTDLLRFMEDDQPFTNGKLSLKEVATKLNVSTNYLSQVINENLNKNFFDFVNEYRVNLIKEKMKDPNHKQFTLLALAFDCGFNSKSNFNVIFKKHTGLTPTAYQKIFLVKTLIVSKI